MPSLPPGEAPNGNALSTNLQQPRSNLCSNLVYHIFVRISISPYAIPVKMFTVKFINSKDVVLINPTMRNLS